MIDHLGINCADLDAAKRFYDTVLGTLGYKRLMDFEVAIGYGKDKPDFWLSAYEDMPANREVHIAFEAADPDAVQAFHEAAVSLGAESLHAPRLWPGIPRALLRRVRPRPRRQQRRSRLPPRLSSERRRSRRPWPRDGDAAPRPATHRFCRISRASAAVADGVLPTLTPTASRASCFAAAVPDEPETMAPAWPMVLPSGAVKPAT